MPAGWRARFSKFQGARAALNRPRLEVDTTPESPAAPRDPFVDYPPLLRMVHPTWWHVYRIELAGPVLIAECRTEEAAHFVMSRANGGGRGCRNGKPNRSSRSVR